MIDLNSSVDVNDDSKIPNRIRISQLLIFRSGYRRFSYALKLCAFCTQKRFAPAIGDPSIPSLSESNDFCERPLGVSWKWTLQILSHIIKRILSHRLVIKIDTLQDYRYMDTDSRFTMPSLRNHLYVISVFSKAGHHRLQLVYWSSLFLFLFSLPFFEFLSFFLLLSLSLSQLSFLRFVAPQWKVVEPFFLEHIPISYGYHGYDWMLFSWSILLEMLNRWCLGNM